jgi:hypothetical protein
MNLKKLKLNYERAKRKCQTPPLESFVQGGRDVFVLMPDTTSQNFKSELRKHARLLEVYPGVVALRDDAYRVGLDMKSVIVSSGTLDNNHPGLWAYNLVHSPSETASQENLTHAHVHSV